MTGRSFRALGAEGGRGAVGFALHSYSAILPAISLTPSERYFCSHKDSKDEVSRMNVEQKGAAHRKRG